MRLKMNELLKALENTKIGIKDGYAYRANEDIQCIDSIEIDITKELVEVSFFYDDGQSEMFHYDNIESEVINFMKNMNYRFNKIIETILH